MTDQHQEVLSKVVSILQKNSAINALWFYGSVAKGNAREDSDLDLAVQFNQYIKDELERMLRPELLKIDLCSELKLPEKLISMVDLAQVTVPFAWEILSTGKLLFAKNEAEQFRLEQKISSQYELDVLYWRNYDWKTL